MSRKITKRTNEAYEFVKNFFEINKYSPSMREIADALDTSTSVVAYILDTLVEFGKIERVPKISRGIIWKEADHETEKEIHK